MVVLKIKEENKMYTFGSKDYKFSYNVAKRAENKGYLTLMVDNDMILSTDVVGDLDDIQSNIEETVTAICEFLQISSLDTINIFRFEIDPYTGIADIVRSGKEYLMNRYGILPE